MYTPDPELISQTQTTPGHLSRQLRIKPWIRDPAPTIVFNNANIVIPETSSVLHNQSVMVTDGKVKSIARRIDVGMKEKVLVVDLEGKYLCPGLIDCHVHVTAVPGVKTMGEAVS